MVASWELLEQKKVLVGILHVDTTTLAWSFGLRNLIIPGQILPTAGMPFDHARNQIAQVALEQGFEFVFYLDSDVIPPRDAILRLLAHNHPFISGLYSRRSPPHGVPVMIKDRQWVTRFQPGSVVDVDYVGSGCLLIHRSVFERLPPQADRPEKRWFDWRVDMKGLPGVAEDTCLSEDFALCRRVKAELGIQVKVDTSIVCRHVGYAQAGYDSFVPLETTANT